MHKKSKGAALVMVLLVFVVLILIGSILLDVSLSGRKQVIAQVNNMKAYYTAQSGANAMASYIIQHPTSIDNLIAKTSETTPGIGKLGEGNIFNVYVTSATGGVIIKSKGIVNGGLPANVSLFLKNITNEKFGGFTVFSYDAPDIGKNVIIDGPIGSNADRYNGDPHNPPDFKPSMNIPPLAIDPSLFKDTLVTPYHMNNGDKKYFKVNGDIDDTLLSKISINPGDKAEVHLYTTAPNKIALRYVNNPPTGITFYLYYDGTENVTITNGTFTIKNCAIFAPNAEFYINGGGNGIFDGIALVNDCKLPNSHATINNSIKLNFDNISGAQIYQREKWGN